MGCILFSGAYFTPKAGMVGFLLQQLHPTRREPIRGGFTGHHL